MSVQEALTTAERVPYRLSVDDFLLLDGAGHFRGRKTELLGGEIFCINAQHRPHARVKMRLYDAFRSALAESDDTLAIMVEVSVALTEHDAPEPDLTLTSEPDGDGLIPGPSVALIVEVADATVRTDLTDKAALYAAAGVPEYWVADVDARVIHQMWHPADGAFAERREVAFGVALTAATIADLTIATDRL